MTVERNHIPVEPQRPLNVRAEKLRARGLIGPRKPAPASREALRRARIAQKCGAGRTSLGNAVGKRIQAESFTVSWTIFLPSLAGSMVLAATGFVFSGSLAALLLAIAGFALTWLAAGYWSAKAAVATASAEIATAQAFDGLINSRASRLPDDALVELRDIKGVLAQLLPRLKAATNAGVIGTDDVFFVHQAVERYLPDAIDPYLKFSQPAAEHARMMLQQLDLVKEKMHLLTVKLDGMHALELARNRKFLERKLKS